jgi:hypothetical protein
MEECIGYYIRKQGQVSAPPNTLFSKFEVYFLSN